MRSPNPRVRTAPRIDRRQFLSGGLSLLAATTLSPSATAASRRETLSGQRSSSLETAINFDTDTDGQFTNRMQIGADPAGDGRKNVVHVTSNGAETTDYAVSMVDVRDASLTLGDVTESGSLTYEYYQGSKSTSVVPGPVYLLLRTSDGLYNAFRIGRDQRKGGWHTRDVSTELSVGRWRARKVGHPEDASLTAETIVGGLLQGEASDLFEDVPGRFGTDAQLLGVGVGNGQFSEPVTVDAYFDSVTVSDESTPIPALVHLESSFERSDSGNRLNVALAPPSGAEGTHLSLDAVDPRSVRLWQYSPIAPPVLGGGTGSALEPIGATRAGDNGNLLRIAFDLGETGGGTSADAQPMLVSGTLQADRKTAFLAASERGVSGR